MPRTGETPAECRSGCSPSPPSDEVPILYCTTGWGGRDDISIRNQAIANIVIIKLTTPAGLWMFLFLRWSKVNLWKFTHPRDYQRREPTTVSCGIEPWSVGADVCFSYLCRFPADVDATSRHREQVCVGRLLSRVMPRYRALLQRFVFGWEVFRMEFGLAYS